MKGAPPNVIDGSHLVHLESRIRNAPEDRGTVPCPKCKTGQVTYERQATTAIVECSTAQCVSGSVGLLH